MKTFRKIALPVFVSLSTLAMPLIVAAQCSNGATGCVNSPLSPQFSSIPNFIAGALKVMVEIALPVIAVFIVIAGFQFVAARGNSEKLKKARNNFLYVVLGALLILGAWVIATLIGATVSQVLGS